MKKFILSMFIICSFYAQDSVLVWKKEMQGKLNFSQTGFDNWVQGGEDSEAWLLELNYNFIKDVAGYNWLTRGKMSYGTANIGSSGSRKSNDELSLESIYTYKLDLAVNPYFSFSGLTQFAQGIDYKLNDTVSTFADPLYLNQSIGFGYSHPSSFNLRFGFNIKETITNIYTGFSDDILTSKIEKTKVETGLKLSADFNNLISEKIKLTSKLDIFSSLKSIKEVDVTFDNTFFSQVTDLINITYSFVLFYDYDLDYSRQIKRNLSVGLVYNVF
jgi:hypothetical protein